MINNYIKIDNLRHLGSTRSKAAAGLLELHDRGGLNLHEAPNLLAFVVETLEDMGYENVTIENNHV